ncbi:hypothetical protein [Corynebacterium fournieri]|uniref:hypothetical protein n=1 Tax=Corynebacterium fournieri TaxID=1852390 RepID=UPI0025B3FF00|nr:hypothetical protein [Corynebacterium fournieri]WJY97521.1 hypothetical protein CFOUR_05515 [Corynebacterium fournieri]
MRSETPRPRRQRRLALLAVPAAALLAAPVAPLASAQLPNGMSPDEVQSMIPSEISVPAGQSTTVDVGVPVDVNYSSGGWTVTSSGTSVTVSAPDQPGATASVPASAGGYTASVNLVAVDDGSADFGGEGSADAGGGGSAGAAGSASQGGNDGADAGAEQGAGGSAQSDGERSGGEQGGSRADSGESGESGGSASSGGAGGEGAPAVSHPQRSKAEAADSSAAKKLYFDGEIQGNKIVVKVPLNRVKDLMQYASYDTEGATLRYLDVNGQIIEGVERKVDKAARTITLTYPEGETPDNPFIMEVVRDSKADFVAVITSSGSPVEQAGDDNADNEYGSYAQRDNQGRGVDESTSLSDVVPLAIAGVALLAALALLIVFLRKRRGRA